MGSCLLCFREAKKRKFLINSYGEQDSLCDEHYIEILEALLGLNGVDDNSAESYRGYSFALRNHQKQKDLHKEKAKRIERQILTKKGMK